MKITKRGVLITAGVTIVGGVVVYIIVNNHRKNQMIKMINDALDKDLGSTGTSADIAKNDGFDPTFYKKQPSGTALVTVAVADAMAKRIHDDVGTLYDNEEDIIKALTSIGTKTKLSFVSERFQLKYGVGMGKFIMDHVDKGGNAEQVEMLVRNMPNR